MQMFKCYVSSRIVDKDKHKKQRIPLHFARISSPPTNPNQDFTLHEVTVQLAQIQITENCWNLTGLHFARIKVRNAQFQNRNSLYTNESLTRTNPNNEKLYKLSNNSSR